MIYAKQSTALTVTVGPVLDADGVAVTDGVVADFKIAKAGGAPAALNASATLTHRHTGHYALALTTSDTDTIGHSEIVIDDTVNSCAPKEITVLHANVHDWLFGTAAPNTATPLDAAGVRTAVGLASANLDTQLGDLPTAAENAVAVEAAILNEGDATALLTAISAKVEEFLINEGDATATLAAIATAVNAAVAAGTVGTNVEDIKAKTDNLPASPAAVGSAMTLSDAERQTLSKIFWPHGNVYFVTTGGDSGNSGLSPSSPLDLATALATAVSGDMVLLSAGTYLGAFTVANSGVKIVGPSSAVIAVTGNNAKCLTAKSDTIIEGISLTADASATGFSTGVSAAAAVTGLIVRNVHFSGLTDAVWSIDNPISGRLEDCVIEGGSIDTGQVGAAELHLARCVIHDSLSCPGANKYIHAVDCHIDVNTSSSAVNIGDSTSTVILSGGSVINRGSGMELANDSGGTLIVAGTKYRPTKTTGTITQVRPHSSLDDNTVTAAALAADAVTEIQSGLAVPGDAMALTPAERTATATALEAAILDEGDATALLAAIAAKVEEFLVNEGDATATIAAIATACNAAIAAGTVGTNVAAAKGVADKLDGMLEMDGAVHRWTTNALEQAPAGGGGGGSLTVEQAAQLESAYNKTLLLGSGDAPTVVTSVNAAGKITLYQGVDYLESLGRSIDLIDADGSTLPAAGSDLRLQARHPGREDAFEVDGTVVDPGDGSLIARFDVARAEAADLHPDARYAYYVYEVIGVGELRRLDITGTLDLRRGLADAA